MTESRRDGGDGSTGRDRYPGGRVRGGGRTQAGTISLRNRRGEYARVNERTKVSTSELGRKKSKKVWQWRFVGGVSSISLATGPEVAVKGDESGFGDGSDRSDYM
jgi:hypothetical protein